VRVGKLNLVDLAGSERQSKTGATGAAAAAAWHWVQLWTASQLLSCDARLFPATAGCHSAYLPLMQLLSLKQVQLRLGSSAGSCTQPFCATLGAAPAKPFSCHIAETLSQGGAASCQSISLLVAAAAAM
jgi:hypothetical protein